MALAGTVVRCPARLLESLDAHLSHNELGPPVVAERKHIRRRHHAIAETIAACRVNFDPDLDRHGTLSLQVALAKNNHLFYSEPTAS
jgi:hypothetical protein